MGHTKEKGYLSKSENLVRGLAPQREIKYIFEIPIVGKIAAGQPIEAIERKLERDSYMSAEESRDFGIVDEVVDSRPVPELADSPKS